MHMHMARLFLCVSFFVRSVGSLSFENLYIAVSPCRFSTPLSSFFLIFFSFLLISRCLPRQSLRPLLSAEFKRKSSILCAQIHMENQGIMVAAHDEDGLT